MLYRIRNIFTFHKMFKFYIHYLHVYLTGMEDGMDTIDETIDAYLYSYDRFYNLFKEKDHKQLFSKYVQCSANRMIGQLNKHNVRRVDSRSWRMCIYRFTYLVCDHYLNIFDNIITSFDNQNANKQLIFKLMQIFRNQIKN